MKNSIFQKIILPICFVTITIGLVGYAVNQSNKKMLDSAKWVDRTVKIINLSENILSLTKDIESGARGYVITKDNDFLKPILFAKTVVFKNIAALKAITKDKVVQQVLLDSLAFYIQKRIAFSDKIIDMVNTVGIAPTIKVISAGEGKYYSDKIRLIAKEIESKEYELLKERKLLNEKDIALFYWFLGALFVLMSITSALFLISYYKNLIQTRDKILQADELILINNELKISEAKYQKLNEELEQLVVVRTAKLEMANKELESFSYSVSHDLRAPIRAINGYTRILEEDYAEKFDDDGRLVLSSIVKNSIKMGALIDDLLAFSQLGRKQISGSEIKMQEMVGAICEEELKSEKGQEIQFTIQSLPVIYGDPALIKQVWINLISNAVKYSKYKPISIIEIGSYPRDAQTVYFIKDNGAGFDMKYYNKLFGVFQRLHGQDEFEGTGIGLAIVQKIVNKHNGTVWGESILNEGSSFYFSLPNNKTENTELNN